MDTFCRRELKNYQLTISDSEILAYIYGADENYRERLILAALRIGFITLSEAKNDIDRKTIIDMTEQLSLTLTNQQQVIEKSLHNWISDNGPLNEAISKNLKYFESLFDETNKNGIATKIQQTVKHEVSKLSEQWSLDNHNSAFKRLKLLFDEQLATITQTLHQRLDELKSIQLEQQIRKDESTKGTRHGEVFEDALNDYLSQLCTKQGHIFEATGDFPGLIKNCKVGDAVITLSPEHFAAGANIVVEAKQSKSYSIKKALDEIAIGRKNRNADFGIFVLSKSSAPSTWPIFQRYQDDLMVIWDAEHPSSDIYLEAAISVAVALCSKKQYQAVELPDFLPMQQAVIDLEKQLEGCDEIYKLTKTIMVNSDKILKRSEIMGQTAKEKIGDLYRCLEQLNRLEIGLIE